MNGAKSRQTGNNFLTYQAEQKYAPPFIFPFFIRTFAAAFGKLPEWSIGPHSKCGVRVTVPGVRIPHFPQGTVVVKTTATVFLLPHPTLHPQREDKKNRFHVT